MRREPTPGTAMRRTANAQRPEPAAQWVDEGVVDAAAGAVARSRRAGEGRDRRAGSVPSDVVRELVEAVGARRGERLASQVAEARRAFDRDRYAEARSLLVRVAAEAPASAATRELLGLTLYRMDRWKAAVVELEAYRTLSNGVEQHPVLMDCYRALRRHDDVETLWAELREASPSAEVVAEGRIVMAGSLSDRRRVADAVELLERAVAGKSPRRVLPHHLRTWYVLADLYERAGDLPRARTWFRRVQTADAGFSDVAERLASLG